MKISELKQPYRRMAEYLADRNTDKDFRNKEILMDAFNWFRTDEDFWYVIYCGGYPPITEGIKKNFPPDFDFSVEDIKTKPVMQMLDAETQKMIYTQLAREGKFDQLPDTCEFSEPVELDVWDNELMEPVITNVLGKFKSRYVTEANLCWQYAKLPTPKIDFSKFKSGDVVEVECYGDKGCENIVGYIYELKDYSINISIRMSYLGDYEIISKQNIKSITKIK